MVMTFAPTLKLMGRLDVPEVTGEPFTVIEAYGSEVVGVTVMEAVAFETLAV